MQPPAFLGFATVEDKGFIHRLSFGYYNFLLFSLASLLILLAKETSASGRFCSLRSSALSIISFLKVFTYGQNLSQDSISFLWSSFRRYHFLSLAFYGSRFSLHSMSGPVYFFFQACYFHNRFLLNIMLSTFKSTNVMVDNYSPYNITSRA